MGDSKYSFSSAYDLNISNPATYHALESTVFDVGFFFTRNQQTSGGLSQTNDNGGLAYFGLGFPIAKRWGFTLGALPVTQMGYNIRSDSVIDGDDVSTDYTGSGGLSQVTGGLSFQVIDDSLQSISLGANLLYTFGTLEQFSYNLFLDPGGSNGFNTAVTRRSYTSDITFEIGVHAKRNITPWVSKSGKRRHFLAAGVTVSLPRDLRTEFLENVQTQAGSFPRDTIVNNRDTGTIFFPLRYGLGVSYEVINENTKSNWLFQADWEQTNWSDLEISGNPEGLNDRWQASFGTQLIPNTQASRGILKTMRYRAGFRYAQTRLRVNEQDVSEYGISFGLGLPLVRSRSIRPTSTTVNISYEYVERGNDKPGLIRERYSNFVIGVSLTPSFWDKWFQRRRID